MKIKVKKDFYDREADLVLRKKGAEFEVTEKRGRELIDGGFAEQPEKKKKESET